MTTSGTNLEHARAHNRRVVIEAIRLNGELTRAELARITSLTPQTVSNIATELEQAGILSSHLPRRVGGRGQPATPLTLNPDSAYSIGIHLDHQSLLVVLVDLSGRVRFRRLVQVQKPQPEPTLLCIENILQEMRQSPEINQTLSKGNIQIDWRRMLGIGIVMPGPFGVEGISSLGPTTLHGWDNIDVESRLSAMTGWPVTLENDATVAAIGERFHGVAKQLSSFVYLYIGTGLGAGIFTDGRIYTGHAHNAGEVGHMVVQPGGRACYCGNNGCLERYLSLQAAYEGCGLDPVSAVPEDLLAIDEALFDQWLETAIEPACQAINIIECVFDAQCVIIGGMMPQPLVERLMKKLTPLYSSVRSRYPDGMRLRLGMTGADTAALGAAALPIFDEFNPQYEVLLK